MTAGTSGTVGNSGLGLFDLADRRLAYLDHRQQVLAQNVANANTPGWQARDLQPFAAVIAGHFAIVPMQTNPMHMPGNKNSAGDTVKITAERAPDGNGVKLDEQLSKVADTEMAQTTTTKIYTKYLALYRLVLGR